MKWTNNEIELLRNLYSTTNVNMTVEIIKKSKRQILNKARTLGLKKSDNYVRVSNPWCELEINFLIENFSKMKTKEISEKLNKKYDEVRWMIQKLKLKKDSKYISSMSTKRNIDRSGDKYNIDNLKDIANMYKTRSQFINGNPIAYDTARKRGVLNEICKHMYVGKYSTPQLIMKYILEDFFNEKCLYNDRKTISPYELDVYFPDRKIAFEFNGIFWHKNDDKKNLDKNKLCKEKSIDLFIVEERSQNYFEDIREQLSIILKSDIKIEPDYDLIFENIFTYEKIREEMSKHDSLEELKVNDPKLYRKLHTMKIYKEMTSHIKKKRVRRWCEEDAISIISEFQTMKDFLENYGKTLHRWIKRNNKEYLLTNLIN